MAIVVVVVRSYLVGGCLHSLFAHLQSQSVFCFNDLCLKNAKHVFQLFMLFCQFAFNLFGCIKLLYLCFSCDVSNRLSRESSQDILVEDLDRLSTTSAMSESSVSHRLNDVQDVQDIARMQEESKLALFFISSIIKILIHCFVSHLLLCFRSKAFHTIEKPTIRYASFTSKVSKSNPILSLKPFN